MKILLLLLLASCANNVVLVRQRIYCPENYTMKGNLCYLNKSIVKKKIKPKKKSCEQIFKEANKCML